MKYLRLIVTILLWECLLHDATSQVVPNCPFGATEFNDYMCYRRGENPVDRVDAVCPDVMPDSSLISIKFAAEQQKLEELAGGETLWTSARRVGITTTFRWGDGSNVSDAYTNWADGQPGINAANNCLVVPGDGKWIAVPCNSEKYFAMCESLIPWNGTKLQQVLVTVRHNLKDEIAQLKATIESIQASLSGATGRIQALEDGSTSTNNAINEVKGRVDAAEGNISELKGQVSSVETGLTGIGERVGAAEAKLTVTESDIGGLKSGLEATNDKVVGLETVVADLTSRVAAVEVLANENKRNIDQNAAITLTVAEDLYALEERVTKLETPTKE